MKTIITILFIFSLAICGAQELTLTQKSTLAQSDVFRYRIFQGLFSKANYHRLIATPANLKAQKQKTYAIQFLKGGANTIDIYAVTRFWLANYNANPPVLDGNAQPTDTAILDTAALDTVFDALAGVVAGDELLPTN